jgi:hypothetical protein
MPCEEIWEGVDDSERNLWREGRKKRHRSKQTTTLTGKEIN